MIKVRGFNQTEQDNWDGLYMGVCTKCGSDVYLKGSLKKCYSCGHHEDNENKTLEG